MRAKRLKSIVVRSSLPKANGNNPVDKAGARAAVVVTAGLSSDKGTDKQRLHQKMLEAARPHCVRILGPNCLGLLIPEIGLNASFAHVQALPGQVAFVSQCSALCSAALDWARSNEIGFSHFVSLGDGADVDAGRDRLGRAAR